MVAEMSDSISNETGTIRILEVAGLRRSAATIDRFAVFSTLLLATGKGPVRVCLEGHSVEESGC